MLPHLFTLLLALLPADPPATCTYETWTWSVVARRAVHHRHIAKPYAQLTEEIRRSEHVHLLNLLRVVAQPPFRSTCHLRTSLAAAPCDRSHTVQTSVTAPIAASSTSFRLNSAALAAPVGSQRACPMFFLAMPPVPDPRTAGQCPRLDPGRSRPSKPAAAEYLEADRGGRGRGAAVGQALQAARALARYRAVPPAASGAAETARLPRPRESPPAA